MFKISIIIPFYNTSKYIDRCLNSLINQTIGIENLQLILVDDASTDDTPVRLKEYEQKFPEQITLILCEENGKQGTARNIGLKYAVAPYIGYIDSDDWVELDMFEKMYEKITTYNCDIVNCKIFRDDAIGTYEYKKETGKPDSLILIEDDKHRESFIVSEIIGVGAPDKLYKKEFLIKNNITFPEKIAYEDIYFGSLLYLYANKIYIIEENLYHYYVNWNSTVLQMDKPYHADILTVGELKLAEFSKRGILDKYPLATEYNFVKTYYLASLKVLILRYTVPSYELFLRIKKRTREVVPNYKLNPYFENAFSEVYQLLLELLDCDVSESDFQQIVALVKQLAGK
ncbi:MAG: glycosyltransferase family 2 protein [Lachnospiraceae bacterium]|nr:glycosyltransferase family 2 protein [Lachnospiraceae bacterium]